MQRYRILHRTYYNFPAEVRLEPHALRLREGHELRIESSSLTITPPATLRWHRDVEDNSVAIATFDVPSSQLLIESEVIIQQLNQTPLDFLVDDDAVDYPFLYPAADKAVLAPGRKSICRAQAGRSSIPRWGGSLGPSTSRWRSRACPNPFHRSPAPTWDLQVQPWMWASGSRRFEARCRPVVLRSTIFVSVRPLRGAGSGCQCLCRTPRGP